MADACCGPTNKALFTLGSSTHVTICPRVSNDYAESAMGFIWGKHRGWIRRLWSGEWVMRLGPRRTTWPTDKPWLTARRWWAGMRAAVMWCCHELADVSITSDALSAWDRTHLWMGGRPSFCYGPRSCEMAEMWRGHGTRVHTLSKTDIWKYLHSEDKHFVDNTHVHAQTNTQTYVCVCM